MELHLSPKGDDTADGLTAVSAVASLQCARDLARQLRSGDENVGIEIILADGVYRLDETLSLERQDGGHPCRPTVWRAADGTNPVLSGAVSVTAWERLAVEPDHLPPDARGKVWMADLPAGMDDTRTLYDGDRRLQRAQGEGFPRLPMPESDTENPNQRFAFPKGVLANWPDVAHAELVIIPSRTWTMNILPVKTVDESAGIAETAVPCTYSLAPNHRKVNTWVENSLAVLREPGMWCCDPTVRKLYLWPLEEEPGDAIAVGRLTELIRIEGDCRLEAGSDHPVQDIELQGLTFAHGERVAWHGRTGGGLQHDWDLHDSATALLRLRGAARCTIAGCTFRDSASGGARLDLYAQQNTFDDCVFAHLGGTGVTFAGYGLGTKDVNRGNVVNNCHIHHIGEVYWHSPAVFIWQSGTNYVGHNLIHNTPYTGIVCSGRTQWDRSGKGEGAGAIRWKEVDGLLGGDYKPMAWHVPERWRQDWLLREPLMHSRNNRIEWNDIHDVMEIMGDGNGVYISGTGGGNQVCHNAVHDCPSASLAEGIRCDDDQHDTVTDGNLIYHLGGLATGITIKGVNVVTNNTVAAPLVEKTGRGLISLEVGPIHGSTIAGNILYALTPEHRFYAQKRLGCHGEGPEPLLRDCLTDHNLYWCESAPSAAEDHLMVEREFGVEEESMVADPGFVDAVNGDFHLLPDSPLTELGFMVIDQDEVGLIVEE